jgi:hypothetical protein
VAASVARFCNEALLEPYLDQASRLADEPPIPVMAECADDFHFLGYSGLVVLTASLTGCDPKRI